MKKSTFLRWLVWTLAIFTVIVLLSSFFISHYYLSFSRHKAYDHQPSDHQMAFSEVEFPSRIDQVTLQGWFIPPSVHSQDKRLGEATVIVVHGHNSNMGKIGAINLLTHIAKPLHAQGFSVLMLDLRNHGRSDDLQPVTLGYWEKDDVLGAIDFLDAHSSELGINPERMGIFGVSMGGATSIYATAADNQGKKPHIKAAFIESAFARTQDPIQLKLGIDGVPVILQKLLFFWFSALPARDILQNNPIEYIHDITAPLYFVHSQRDPEVRPEDSQEMYERARRSNANRIADLWISPGTGHATTPAEFPVEFTERLIKFFTTHL